MDHTSCMEKEVETHFATQHGETMAKVTTSYILRDKIRGHFWHDMVDENEDIHFVATALFDRYGLLKPVYYNHPICKGTGVWGEELGEGGLVFFSNLCVKKTWSRVEQGAKLVHDALESLKSKFGNFIAFARPGSDGTLEMDETFWRSVGFRRVATTVLFAFTPDPDHPSRKLDVSQDFRPQMPHPDRYTMPDHIHGLYEMLADHESLDDDCLDRLHATLPDAEDPSWRSATDIGRTLLHAASITCKPKCIQYILARQPALATTKNLVGLTPVEALMFELDWMRSSMESEAEIVDMSQDVEAVTGFPEDIVRSLALLVDWRLQKGMRLKYGCTCGDCACGFLSPRMQERLSLVSKEWPNPDDDIQGYVKYQIVPESIRQIILADPNLRRGFSKLFECFYLCIGARRAPTVKNIMKMKAFLASREDRKLVHAVSQCFIEVGEDAACIVANAVLLQVKSDDTIFGRGDRPYRVEDDKSDYPRCRNDREYAIVGRLCRIEARGNV